MSSRVHFDQRPGSLGMLLEWDCALLGEPILKQIVCSSKLTSTIH